MTGTILTIQHYAVQDGPGIRTLVFFKGCPLHCAWCCNPESQSARPQLRYIAFRCKSCLECVAFCPHAPAASKQATAHHAFEACGHCLEKECINQCNFDALALSGREISADDLVEIVAKDIPFYLNSEGGVTFSGGEPLMQPVFLLEMLKKCRQRGIHTAVETCGWAPEEVFRDILPYTGLFLYDLKIVDPALHLAHTGKPVEPVIRNLAFLASQGADIIIRFPLIPGITDTPGNLEDIVGIMKKNELKQICLEPYHTLGTEKYAEHGMQYPLDETGQHERSQLASFVEFFRQRGFTCETA